MMLHFCHESFPAPCPVNHGCRHFTAFNTRRNADIYISWIAYLSPTYNALKNLPRVLSNGRYNIHTHRIWVTLSCAVDPAVRLFQRQLPSSDHASNCAARSTAPFDGCSCTGLASMITPCEPSSSATTLILKMSYRSPVRRIMSATDNRSQVSIVFLNVADDLHTSSLDLDQPVTMPEF